MDRKEASQGTGNEELAFHSKSDVRSLEIFSIDSFGFVFRKALAVM